MGINVEPAFAMWVTGLPSSGKSTLTQAVVTKLRQRGVDVAVLESDVLRRVLTPDPIYSPQERDTFYASMLHVGGLLVQHGVPVIFDATANRRVYRERARARFPRFIEVYLDCPLELCMARDPKGIYRDARAGGSTTVPGLQSGYEPPIDPEVHLHGPLDSADTAAADQVITALLERGYIAQS
jgi:adenylylsulfate kinase